MQPTSRVYLEMLEKLKSPEAKKAKTEDPLREAIEKAVEENTNGYNHR